MRTENVKADDVEASFRRSLEDAEVIVAKLSPLCDDLEHLLALVRSARADDSVFHFVFNLLAQQGKK